MGFDPLPCIRCGKIPESVVPDDIPSDNHPSEATVFISYGQYGSTVWDPMSIGPRSEYLELNICDMCLKHLGKKGLVLRVVETKQRPNREYTHWRKGISVHEIDDNAEPME